VVGVSDLNEPANGLRWRVDNLERRLSKVEAYELAVVVRNISELEADVRELRSQLKWQTRALIGAMLTMLAGIAVILLTLPHG
jgi:hypothetical protein